MRSLIWATVALLTAACSYDLGDVRDPLGDDVDAVTWDDAALPVAPPADDEAPTVEISEVEDLGDGTARLSGISGDDRAVVSLFIHVDRSGPYPVPPAPEGYTVWSAVVPIVPAGPVEFTAEVFDASGHPGRATVMLERPRPNDMTAPVVVITEPMDGLETNAARLFIRGTAMDASGVRSVDVVQIIDGDEMPVGPARTGDHFATWGIDAPLAPGVRTTFVARARDSADRLGEARVTVNSRAAPPHAAPRLVSSAPADGATVAGSRQTLSMEFESGAPIEAVWVRVGDAANAAATGGGRSWEAPVRLRPGANAITVVARDAVGLVGRAVITVTMDDGYGDGPIVALGVPGEPGGEVVLDLDKAGVLEMFPVDVQRSTVLMNLDPRAMVTNALGVIRAACGPGWDGPDFVPQCPAEWGAPERNLWGLLTMTPRRADVSGTSLAGAAERAIPFLGLPFGQILGDALQVGYDEVVLPDEPLVDAIVDLLIASHPNAGPGGALPVTLEDGLLDMRPLGDRFGPEADHPGFIAGAVEAGVLTADFRMGLTLISNLRLYEGVDLRASRKDYFGDRPPGSPVVELEFEQPGRFSLSGIDPSPVVAMDFQMIESDTAATPGNSLEPFGLGDSDVWAFAPWMLERVVAQASLNAFGELRTGCDLCGAESGEGLIYSDPMLGSDLAELVIGRLGYDCLPGETCPNEDIRNAVGLAEHFANSLDRHDCRNINECANRFGPDFQCHPQGRCVDANEIECFNDRQCAAGERCLAGTCAVGVECVSDAECAGATVCYQGGCIEVPAGWFRLWMPQGAAPLPDPAYMWDIVLEVAQARMRDGGVAEGEGDALFHLEGVSVGLTDADIEAQVREQLQAQRLTLADALLGRYVDPEHPLDLFVDAFGEAGWLMINPCRIGLAHPDAMRCADPMAAGLYSEPAADAASRLDADAPSGLRGVPLASLAVGESLYFRDADDTIYRLDVEAVDATTVRLWLRGEAR
ncbi:MAG: hypothetical protein H6705_12780 [Myxococcales bacterium]|nr:hypothetical protein [Myxococcales bacterium]